MNQSSPDGPAKTAEFHWERVGDVYVAEWPGILTLYAALDGRIQEIIPASDAAQSVVEKIRRGAATAFVRALAGKASLHASAVALGNSALLLVGPSGSGKSTLAAAFCEHCGAELLADDVTGLDRPEGQWHALPSESAVWLGSGTGGVRGMKAPFAFPVAQSSKVIACAIQLAFGDSSDGMRLRSLRGADSAAAFLSALMRFDASPPHMKREIDLVGSLVTQIPVVELVRSRSAPPYLVIEGLLNELRAKGNLVVEWPSA